MSTTNDSNAQQATPRTDAVAFPRTAAIERGSDWNAVEANFARTLERELAEARKQSVLPWKYCPECGDANPRAKGYLSNAIRQCNCLQEWFTDIDYTDVVQKNLGKLAALRAERDALVKERDRLIRAGDAMAHMLQPGPIPASEPTATDYILADWESARDAARSSGGKGATL